MVIRNFKYTAEDVDCRYCTEFRHGRCRAQKCPWLKERIEAGVLSYREAVNEAFTDPSPLQTRIKIVLRHYKKSFWRDKIHAQRFDRMQAILGYYQERNTNAFYAALFLLSSDEELIRRVANCFTKKQIDFSKADLRNLSPEQYALYKIAKCLYMDSSEVSIDEIADPELVNTESFHLVINAILIYRYGLSALYLKSEDGVNGCMQS